MNKMLAERRLEDGSLKDLDMESLNVHSLYQDLFLTDLKKEVVEANNEALLRVAEIAELRKEVATLKKALKEANSKIQTYRSLVAQQHHDMPPTDFEIEARGASELSGMKLVATPSGRATPVTSPSRGAKDTLDLLQLERMLNSLKRLSRCQNVGTLITSTLE